MTALLVFAAGGCASTRDVDAVDAAAGAAASDAGMDASADDGDADDAPADGGMDAGPRDSGPDADAPGDASAAPATDAAPVKLVEDDEDAGPYGPFPVDPPCEQQIEESLDGLPDNLACTGLYENVYRKVISSDVRWYAPAVPLWSDGAGKIRWVYLPPGEKIDATDPGEWMFPLGTKFWKEFRVNGRRIETRLYQKVREDRWVRATYAWDRNESAALRNFGEDLPDVVISGTEYHIPTGGECDQCHGGRKDRVLGFSAVSLGLPGAQGVTLGDLVEEDLVRPAPVRTNLVMGDDGTGYGGEVAAWMHVNCGVCCHNDNQNAEAYSSGLYLKLRPGDLDGRALNQLDPFRTSVGVEMKTTRFGEGALRVAPGSTEDSMLYRLVVTRSGNERDQMPPIASQVVPLQQTQLIADWIEALPPQE
ncbi:MAG: hypothetical protein PVI30_18730 [Myxococcales bacterium]